MPPSWLPSVFSAAVRKPPPTWASSSFRASRRPRPALVLASLPRHPNASAAARSFPGATGPPPPPSSSSPTSTSTPSSPAAFPFLWCPAPPFVAGPLSSPSRSRVRDAQARPPCAASSRRVSAALCREPLLPLLQRRRPCGHRRPRSPTPTRRLQPPSLTSTSGRSLLLRPVSPACRLEPVPALGRPLWLLSVPSRAPARGCSIPCSGDLPMLHGVQDLTVLGAVCSCAASVFELFWR